MHVAGTASARVASHLGHSGRALGAVLAGGRQPNAALAAFYLGVDKRLAISPTIFPLRLWQR